MWPEWREKSSFSILGGIWGAAAKVYLERVQKKHKGKADTSVLLRQSMRIGKKVVSRMKRPRSVEQTREAMV